MQIFNNKQGYVQKINNLISKINIDEILFDVFLLMIVAIGRYFFINEKLITFNEHTSVDMVAGIIAVALLILFVYIGTIFGKYKKYKKTKKKRLLLVLIFLWLIISAIIPMEDIMRSVEEKSADLYLMIFFVIILLSSLLGFFIKSKSLQKGLKIF